jgi:thioredoxin reductase (NADPH)
MLGVVAMMLMGLSAVVSKIGLSEFPPLLFTMLRFIVVIPALFFISKPAISWRMLFAITATLVIAHLSLVNMALFLGVSPSTYVFIQQSGAIFAIFFAYLLLNHKPTLYDLVGILLGFAGVYFLLAEKSMETNTVAIAALIGSSIFWGLGSTLIKKANAPAFSTTAWGIVFAIPCMALPLCCIEGVDTLSLHVTHASTIGWLTVFYSGWVSMMGAGAIIFYLIRTEAIGKVMPLYSLVPLFGSLFSFLILGEELSQTMIISAAWICVGVAVSQYGAKIKNTFFGEKTMKHVAGLSAAFLLISTPLYSQAVQAVDVAIIGSGCAGLSAAMVTAEHGMDTHLFAGPSFGGALNVKTVVGNWPGKARCYGNEAIRELEKQALEFGAKLEQDSVISCNFSCYPFLLQTASGNSFSARAVLVATGGRERELSADGYLDYLDKGIFTNRDVYRDMTAFQNAMKGARVLVIGSGDDAMKKAVYAKRAGAKELFVAFRGDCMKVSSLRKKYLDTLPDVKLLPHSTVLQFRGDKKRLSAVMLKTEETTKELCIDYAIISIGYVPCSELFKGKLEMDLEGAILLKNGSQHTSVCGVFAAGDVTSSRIYGQAAIASGDGMKAGYEILRYLSAK